MAFEPIKKGAVAEEIAQQLLSLIKTKQLNPGDKLPPERELAATLQVSRPSLREALRALSIMNVIEMRQGDGTYVSPLEAEQLVDHLDFVLSLDDSTFIQLFEARKIIEVGIVALAAARISDKQIADLEANLERATQSVDDPESFLKIDLALHETITRAANNPILTRIMASISQLAIASRSRTVAITAVRQKTVTDHRAIVAALKQHDPIAAQKAMLNHLSNVEHRLQLLIESQELPVSRHDLAESD